MNAKSLTSPHFVPDEPAEAERAAGLLRRLWRSGVREVNVGSIGLAESQERYPMDDLTCYRAETDPNI